MVYDNDVNFTLAGGKLWVKIQIDGLYGITYTCQLFSVFPPPAGESQILTNPLIAGDNPTSGPFNYQIVNSYTPSETIDKYDGRCYETYFFIEKYADDNGYNINVSILQGDDYPTAQQIGTCQQKATIGSSATYVDFYIDFNLHLK